MISLSSAAGEACRTLYTVRSSVDHASLWNTMTTLVVGRGGQRLNFWSMHLREGRIKKEKGRKSRIYRSYAPGMKNGEGVWGGGGVPEHNAVVPHCGVPHGGAAAPAAPAALPL